MFTSPDALSKKIISSLSRGRVKSLYVGTFIAYNDTCGAYPYFEFLRAMSKKDTLNELGQVRTFQDVIDVCVELCKSLKGERWSDLTISFNSLEIDDETLKEAELHGFKLHISKANIVKLSTALFDAGAETNFLKWIYFAATDDYSTTYALDCVQQEKLTTFTKLKSKSDSHNPVEEVTTFIEKNKLHRIKTNYDESLLCLISSIAYHYYQSDDAVNKLIEIFGAKDVLMSRIDPITNEVIQALEFNIEGLNFDTHMFTGNRWLVRNDPDLDRAVITNKHKEQISPFAKQYIHHYINSQEIDLQDTLYSGERTAIMLHRMGEHGLDGTNFTGDNFEELNLLNLALIKEVVETYVDEKAVSFDWFEDFLKHVKRAEKYQKTPVTDAANSYQEIRDYFLTIKPIGTDVMSHFHPLRIALNQVVSSRERDITIASKLLKSSSIDEVAKVILYTEDVIAFITFYNIDPIAAMSYIDDPELQEFCLTLIS